MARDGQAAVLAMIAHADRLPALSQRRATHELAQKELTTLTTNRHLSNRYLHNVTRDRLLHAVLREIKGMSAKEVEALTGVSRGTIYNWRKLKFSPSSATLHAIMLALGKTVTIVKDE